MPEFLTAARAAACSCGKPSHAFGALLACLLALLTTPACDKKHASPAWNTPGDATPPAAKRAATHKPEVVSDPAAPGLRFVAYNLKNWLTMERGSGHGPAKATPKPAAEKRAVVELLSHQAPDVLGVCEIGSRDDLAELQAALLAGGVALPHAYYTGGGDAVRHLGLLSRFPIIHTTTPTQLDFKLNGSAYTMSRGILDATIQAHDKTYRWLGVHLKSKREVADGDQDAVRLCEARLLRQYVDAILATEPDARLVVYGDFNDTRASAALRLITGNYGEADSLTALPVQDKQGERWTHFWELHDIYSRFDFITVTHGLKHEVDYDASRILDDPPWSAASDHRPLLAVFN
ncbi:MAG: endonuclease/exonuclease/phosphatase family protein [Verrucomicrobia bacterium]|nr:MAG: endonuclease/exonuclease/phosphatase family protein [Verrucomicrobiota bacterium]